MIKRATTVEFRGIADKGRNQPLQVLAETVDGQLVELFLKPSGRPELGIEGVANELFAACIAGHLKLPVCEPVLVNLDRDWIDALPSLDLRQVMLNSSPIAFGSVNAGVGWRPWSSGDQLYPARRDVALGIFAFDAFTGNDDRRAEKPNLLVKGDSLRMIDHELCFRLRMKLFPQVAPWVLGNLTPLIHRDKHVLGPLLRGDRFIDIGALRAGWADLSDDCLEEYRAALPPEWAGAGGAIADAVAHLKAVRDRIDECLDEVRRILG